MNNFRMSPNVRRNAVYGQGHGQVLMEDVSCNGTERNIAQCRHNNKSYCSHKDDVGINCLPCMSYLRFVKTNTNVQNVI